MAEDCTSSLVPGKFLWGLPVAEGVPDETGAVLLSEEVVFSSTVESVARFDCVVAVVVGLVGTCFNVSCTWASISIPFGQLDDGCVEVRVN